MIRTIAVLTLAVGLGACGSAEPDRTQGSVAGGAATGAAIGILGGPIGVAVGAVLGAGAGGLTGAATSPKDVNLGAPPWSETNSGTGEARTANP